MNRLPAMRSRHRKWTPVTQPVRLPEPASRYSTALLLSVPLGFALLIVLSAIANRSLSPLSWYLVRASGVTLYLLFWATVMLGLLLTTHTFDRVLGRGNAYSLHTYLSHLSYAFLAIHVIGLAVDDYLVYSVGDLIAPFRSASSEPWTGFGVLSMWLFIVVALTATSRQYVPYRIWRFLHVLAFPLFLLSALHGIGAGTDSGSSWGRAMYLLTTSTVAGLVLLRIWMSYGQRKGAPPEAGALREVRTDATRSEAWSTEHPRG